MNQREKRYNVLGKILNRVICAVEEEETLYSISRKALDFQVYRNSKEFSLVSSLREDLEPNHYNIKVLEKSVVGSKVVVREYLNKEAVPENDLFDLFDTQFKIFLSENIWEDKPLEYSFINDSYYGYYQFGEVFEKLYGKLFRDLGYSSFLDFFVTGVGLEANGYLRDFDYSHNMVHEGDDDDYFCISFGVVANKHVFGYPDVKAFLKMWQRFNINNKVKLIVQINDNERIMLGINND